MHLIHSLRRVGRNLEGWVWTQVLQLRFGTVYFLYGLVFHWELKLLSLTMALDSTMLYEYIALATCISRYLCIAFGIFLEWKYQLFRRVRCALNFGPSHGVCNAFLSNTTLRFWRNFSRAIIGWFLRQLVAVLETSVCRNVSCLHLDETLTGTLFDILFKVCKVADLTLSALIIEQTTIASLVSTDLHSFLVPWWLFVLS